MEAAISVWTTDRKTRQRRMGGFPNLKEAEAFASKLAAVRRPPHFISIMVGDTYHTRYLKGRKLVF